MAPRPTILLPEVPDDWLEDPGTPSDAPPQGVLGNAGVDPSWSIGSSAASSGSVDPVPSVFSGLNLDRPWTMADSTIHALLQSDLIKTTDFSGIEPPALRSGPDDGNVLSIDSHPMIASTSGGDSSSNGSQAGVYDLPGLGPTYLNPEFADRIGSIILQAQSQNIPLQFTSGYRDPAAQAALQNDPNAITPANQSLHSAGRSVDVNWNALSPDDRANLLTDAAAAGVSWGGNFRNPDPVHFFTDPGTNRSQLIDNFSQGVTGLRNRIPDQ
jgi:hypothetical protein